MRQCPWSLAGRQRRILCSPLPRQNSSWAPYLVSARDGHDGSPSWLCFVESQPLVCGILSRRPNLPEREQGGRRLLNRSVDVVEGEGSSAHAHSGHEFVWQKWGRGDRMVCQRSACGATDKRMVGAVWSLFGKNGVPAKCGFGVRLT